MFSSVSSARMSSDCQWTVNAALTRNDRKWWTGRRRRKNDFLHFCPPFLTVHPLRSIPFFLLHLKLLSSECSVLSEGGKEKPPIASKGILGLWGGGSLFLACWCLLECLSWRWRRTAHRTGKTLAVIMEDGGARCWCILDTALKQPRCIHYAPDPHCFAGICVTSVKESTQYAFGLGRISILIKE